MKIINDSNYILSKSAANKANLGSNSANSRSALSFQGNITTAYDRYVGKTTITYANATKLIEALDGAIGSEHFFSKHVVNSGLDMSKDTLVFKKKSVIDNVIRTVQYPMHEMPGDIFVYLMDKLEASPFQKLNQKIRSVTFIDELVKKIKVRKSLDTVTTILEKFDDITSGATIETRINQYKEDAASGILRTAKNYKSRDERTLNRMATATVSAIFSANDFYNVSMLEKNDKKEAEKSEKGRLGQEISRMGLSAGLTFLSMGALEKYTKNNLILNSIVIASSALISEIVSRLMSKTSLVPLSPEAAAKIAREREQSNQQENKETSFLEDRLNDAKKIVNKILRRNQTNEDDISDKEKIFKQFALHENTYAKTEDFNSAKLKKKPQRKRKWDLKRVVITAFGVCSGIYLLQKGLTGEFGAKIARKKLVRDFEFDFRAYLDGRISAPDPDVENGIRKIAQNQKERIKKFGLIRRFERLITKRKTTANVKQLEKELLRLSQSTDCSSVNIALSTYRKHINVMKEQKIFDIESTTARPITPGIYDGITKIFKTVYTLFSAPAALLNHYVDKWVFAESEKTVNALTEKLNFERSPNDLVFKDYSDELCEVNNLILKYKNKKGGKEKLVRIIERHTRNLEGGGETGELANFSRTLVTLISTYFFVNDYSNNVLIESKGKNIEGAKIARNERIAHKLSNFVINGTLMNLFNSIFKTPLNSSLIAATIIAAVTEMCNESLIRKSICQPIGKMESQDAIIEFEKKQSERKGIMGWWTRTFKQITGKKSYTQKIKNINKEEKETTPIKQAVQPTQHSQLLEKKLREQNK